MLLSINKNNLIARILVILSIIFTNVNSQTRKQSQSSKLKCLCIPNNDYCFNKGIKIYFTFNKVPPPCLRGLILCCDKKSARVKFISKNVLFNQRINDAHKKEGPRSIITKERENANEVDKKETVNFSKIGTESRTTKRLSRRNDKKRSKSLDFDSVILSNKQKKNYTGSANAMNVTKPNVITNDTMLHSQMSNLSIFSKPSSHHITQDFSSPRLIKLKDPKTLNESNFQDGKIYINSAENNKKYTPASYTTQHLTSQSVATSAPKMIEKNVVFQLEDNTEILTTGGIRHSIDSNELKLVTEPVKISKFTKPFLPSTTTEKNESMTFPETTQSAVSDESLWHTSPTVSEGIKTESLESVSTKIPIRPINIDVMEIKRLESIPVRPKMSTAIAESSERITESSTLVATTDDSEIAYDMGMLFIDELDVTEMFVHLSTEAINSINTESALHFDTDSPEFPTTSQSTEISTTIDSTQYLTSFKLARPTIVEFEGFSSETELTNPAVTTDTSKTTIIEQTTIQTTNSVDMTTTDPTLLTTILGESEPKINTELTTETTTGPSLTEIITTSTSNETPNSTGSTEYLDPILSFDSTLSETLTEQEVTTRTNYSDNSETIKNQATIINRLSIVSELATSKIATILNKSEFANDLFDKFATTIVKSTTSVPIHTSTKQTINITLSNSFDVTLQPIHINGEMQNENPFTVSDNVETEDSRVFKWIFNWF